MFRGLADFLRRHRYTDLGIALVVVQLIDSLVHSGLSSRGVIGGRIAEVASFTGQIADGVFAAGLLLGLAAWLSGRETLIRRSFEAYAAIATLNLLENVVSLVILAESKKGQPLFMLYDVAAVYVMNIVVFSAWYMIVDQSAPGGGFLFPRCDGPAGKPQKPVYLDYLFISFNVSSTFGPTLEAVIVRSGKVLMMVQTLVSLVIVTVLVARIVSG